MTTEIVKQPKKKARIAPTVSAQPTNANEAITLHFVTDATKVPVMQTELDPKSGYPPAMTHQIFDEEEILGYIGLRLDIVMCVDTCVSRIFHNYVQKVQPANEYLPAIRAGYPEGLHDTAETFAAACKDAESLPEALENCPQVLIGKTNAGDDVAVYRSNIAHGSDALKKLHNRLQPLLLYYVDAAVLIEAGDDPLWDIMIAVTLVDGKPAQVLGFATVYTYYAFPHLFRKKLSQMLVLPHVQRMGVGRLLVEAVMKDVLDSEGIKDITYEDPADELQHLRERMDAEHFVQVPAIWEAAGSCITKAIAAGAAAKSSVEDAKVVTLLVPPASVMTDMMKRRKIVLQQAQKVWQVLLWAAGAKAKKSQDDIVSMLELLLVNEELSRIQMNSNQANDQLPANKMVLDVEKYDDPDEYWTTPQADAHQNWVLHRTDLPRTAHPKKAEDLPDLDEQAMSNVMELVTMRAEAIERIVHGLRWPTSATDKK